jgi:hypothetical protein
MIPVAGSLLQECNIFEHPSHASKNPNSTNNALRTLEADEPVFAVTD